MVTEDDVRQVALSLPAVVEKPYNRLASFRVGRNLIIRVHELPDTVFVRCANLDERDELLVAEPQKFFITPHYDGYPAILVRSARNTRHHHDIRPPEAPPSGHHRSPANHGR